MIGHIIQSKIMPKVLISDSMSKVAQKIFEKNIVEKLIKDGEDFSKLLDDKNAFERFTINLQTFIYEGDFFVAKKIPLYYLPQKKI